MDGIVLAAGRGRRVGGSKAELRVGDESFLEHAIATLWEGGCRSVVAVVSDPAMAAREHPLDDVVFTLNPDPDSQQIDSLRIGLEALPPDGAGAAVLPVDLPRVRADTVAQLLEAFDGEGVLVVRPTFQGRPGHPTLFARSLFAELRGPGLPDGAESVVAAHESRIVDVPVDDPGVVENVNTPEDYRRIVEEE